jgi:hypothetical protein
MAEVHERLAEWGEARRWMLPRFPVGRLVVHVAVNAKSSMRTITL